MNERIINFRTEDPAPKWLIDYANQHRDQIDSDLNGSGTHRIPMPDGRELFISIAAPKKEWTFFGNKIRWSDPEHEAWKRELARKHGWGGSDSIWTVKFMLIVVYIVIVGIAIDIAVINSLHNFFSKLK